MPNLPMPDGLGTPNLECVMLDIAPLDVREAYGNDLNAGDFFYGDTPELKYAQGPVAEKSAHLTLMFGIHPSAVYHRSVDAVLRGWKPEDLHINHVSFFPSTQEGQDYNVIVGKVAPTPNLLEARARLEVLDFTDRFEDYTPHITLAYIKGSADLQTWVQRMDDAFGDKDYQVVSLSYGDDG